MMLSTAINESVAAEAASTRAELERKFDELLSQHGAALTLLAGSYTNSSSDRDDLMQEIAIAIWQALPRFRGECSERTFLFRIAHNRSISFLSRGLARQIGRAS